MEKMKCEPGRDAGGEGVRRKTLNWAPEGEGRR